MLLFPHMQYSATSAFQPIFAGLLVAFAMTSGVIAPEFGGWVVYTVLFLIGVVPCFYTWKIPETTED